VEIRAINQNVLQKLNQLIEKFILDPSLIRNKLAHGQWRVALNRDNTAINRDITQEIASYDVVVLYRRKNALSRLAAILHDLIQSPNKAHWRDYWTHLVALESDQDMMAAMTYAQKEAQIFEKRSHMHRLGDLSAT
jgi:hypothetical protein